MFTLEGEKAISPESGKFIYGVAILICNRGRLFKVLEHKSKPETGRMADQVGIPCETSDLNEPFVRTFLRGLREETGVSELKNPLLDWSSISYKGLWNFVPGVMAHVISIKCIDPDGLIQSCLKKGDGEVEPVGWINPAKLLLDENLRPGVKSVLEKYLDQK